jgi:hypothetical protein
MADTSIVPDKCNLQVNVAPRCLFLLYLTVNNDACRYRCSLAYIDFWYSPTVERMFWNAPMPTFRRRQVLLWLVGVALGSHGDAFSLAPKWTSRTFHRYGTTLLPVKNTPRVQLCSASGGGGVADPDQWIRWSSDSLQRCHGVSLFEATNTSTIAQLHAHDRFAILSHGVQDDPIYCYANHGALQTFRWSADEFYALPSRYSAPDGAARRVRHAIVQESVSDEFRVLPPSVRQTKDGDLWRITGIWLWNVYNDERQRVGQTALYDRQRAVPLAWDEYRAPGAESEPTSSPRSN